MTDENNIAELKNDVVIPSVLGDVHMPEAKSNLPVPMTIDFGSTTPIQFEADTGLGQSTTELGLQRKPSFLQTAGAEAYDWNATVEATHAAYSEGQNIFNDIPEPNFNPKNYPESFYDVDQKYWPALMESRSKRQLDMMRNRVMSEQYHDESLENGSTFAKVIGGFVGGITDPVNLIPIMSAAKYRKLGLSIIKSAAKAAPGVMAASVLSSGARELDRTTGNMQDFIANSFIDSVAGTALFGAAGGAANLLDKLDLWNVRKLLKPGLDFKMEVNAKNEITGIKAFDTTGNMSADEVSKAQEMANSSFLKSGFYKVPYIGSLLMKAKTLPVLGSPELQMINSHYVTERAFIDRAADHSFYRQGTEIGEAHPRSFELMMKQTYAELTALSAQMNTLHLQRNGFNVNNRLAQSAVSTFQAAKRKTLDVFSKELDKNPFVTREQFDDEIQQVLRTGNPSTFAPVNEAATLSRELIDRTWKNYNEAFGRTVYGDSPKMADEFLMRVYDTDYLNTHKEDWEKVITKYLTDSDNVITQRMEPITSLEKQLQSSLSKHEELLTSKGVTTDKVKKSSDNIEKMRKKIKAEYRNLHNELRTNQDYKYLVDDAYALSSDESDEIVSLLKPQKDLEKKINEQQYVVSALKNQISKSRQSAIKGKTVKTGKKHIKDVKMLEADLAKEDNKLADLHNQHSETEFELYSKIKNGEVNPALYYPETLELKDPNYKLKFREPHLNDITRMNTARAYYDSIMHMNPEDTINDIIGRAFGSSKENTLKSRTVLVPDNILYENNFMTKNLMAKVSNYVSYLTRRTNLKNIYKDVTHDGGIEPLLEKLNLEYKSNIEPWNERKSVISDLLESLDKEKEKAKIEQLNAEKDELNKRINMETKLFNQSKDRFTNAHQRMMGLRKRERSEVIAQGVIRSLTAIANLHLVPLTMVSDFGAIGLQHGVWNLIKDGVYPMISSLNGFLKSKDSEAFREAVGHVHLGLQDVINGHADKNISMETQPYLNMGRTVSFFNNLAHFSANMDLSNYIDNQLQRISAAVIQSELMKNLVDHAAGKASKKQIDKLLISGIDPDKWSQRMVDAFKASDGYKTNMNGYQSMFWKWQDLEAANEFSSAVFKQVKNTIVQRGMFTSPFWTDNMLGMLFQTFTGWGYASVNRYLIPLLQRPDAEKLPGLMFAIGAGALVSPLRRMYRGEDAYPPNMTESQKFYEAFADGSVTSSLANVMSYANFLSGDRLIGDLKNDKFRNRVGIGASSPVFGTVNKMYNFLSALASNEMNQKDAKNMADMLPIFGSLYGRNVTNAIIDHLVTAPTRPVAKAMKNQ